MLKKVKQRASKLTAGASGAPASSFKFQFTVVVHSVEFVVADKKWKPEHLMVEWKRNARVAMTKHIMFDLKPNATQMVTWGDELDMLATLTRDGGGPEYDKKEYKFSFEDVRDKKSRKVLAHAAVNLAPYADVTRAPKAETFTMEIDSTKISSAKISLTISSRFISQGAKEEDEASMYSVASGREADSEEEQEDDGASNSAHTSEQATVVSPPVKTAASSAVSTPAAQTPAASSAVTASHAVITPVTPSTSATSTAEVEKLKARVVELENEITKSKSSAKAPPSGHSDQEFNGLKKENDELRAKLNTLEERHTSELESVKRERDELSEEIKDMHTKHEKSKKKLLAELNTLKEQNNGAGVSKDPSMISTISNDAVDTLKSQITQLELERDELHQSLEATQQASRDERALLEKQLRSSKEFSAQLEKALESAQETITAQEKNLAEASDKQTSLEKALAAAVKAPSSPVLGPVQASDNTDTAELETLRSELETARHDLLKSQEELGVVRDQEAVLVKQLEESMHAQAALAQAQDEMAQREASDRERLAQLEDELASAQHGRAQAELLASKASSIPDGYVQIETDRLDELEADSASLAAERTSWKKERTAFAQREQELQQQIEELQVANDENDEKIESLQSDLDRMVNEAKRRATSGDSDSAGANAQLIEHLEKKIATLTSDLDKAEETAELKIEELQKTVTQMREKHRQNEEDWNDQMAALEEELGDVKKQLNAAKKEVDSWKRKADDLNDDINDARTKPEVLEREAQESRKRLAELESQLRSTKRELQELRAEYDKVAKVGIKAGAAQFSAEKLLREENEKLSKEIAELTQDMVMLKMNLAEDQSIFETLKHAKRDLNEKLKEERAKTTELKKRLTALEVRSVS